MTRDRNASARRERRIPSVSSLLNEPRIAAHAAHAPRAALVDAVRAAVSRVRDGSVAHPADEEWPALVAAELERAATPSLRRVINATGVVLHTNLGRAPLAPEAVTALQQAAQGYSTLEYDLESGGRGSRHAHCVALLRRLTGAEDALVVNNCASALVLALNTLAGGRSVVVSRGELIEIGGSFRIPDIMARSTARLVEIGTTNRTHILDYRAAITEQTAAIVKVHRSNFALHGFTSDVPLPDLARLCAQHSLPLVFDLGSGLLLDLQKYGFPEEPTAGRAIADGAGVVLMSGDKLMGGPQAGVVVGKREIVERMRANPLARALRSDKLTIAALEATLRLHLDRAVAVASIPVLRMLCSPAGRVRERAETLAARLRGNGVRAQATPSTAATGAGAFPAHEIPSAAVALAGDAEELARGLRAGNPPVIGRIRDGRLLLDARSVQEHEDADLLQAVTRALAR